jgi:hypothetical protein
VTTLRSHVQRELSALPPKPVAEFVRDLAQDPHALAVLYYGSTLRTGDLSGLLDFYVLTDGRGRRGLRRMVEAALWPEVSYREADTSQGRLRAKVATMPLETFQSAARGERLDTTIWTRFVQPAALVWARDAGAEAQVQAGVERAIVTAACYAAVLGPERGVALEFWRGLFRQTYQAEFRVEDAGRADELLRVAPERWGRLLPAAWRDGAIPFERVGDDLRPTPSPALARSLRRGWRLRRAMGKPLNLARIGKAAFTFEGAARYAAWKIERHTGLPIEVTPFRERHPLLAAPGVLWKLLRARRPGPQA